MAFYAQELQGVVPAFGWMAGPSGNTRIITLRNRHERRNADSSLAQHTFTLPFKNIRDEAYLQYLKAAHMVMYAQLHSFLVKDWLDNECTNESLGEAPSGTTPVQLIKTYSALGATRARDITKPVTGAVIYQDTGSGPVAKPGTLSGLTGLFTPTTSWAEGADLSWTGHFRVPVRFNNDYMPMSIDDKFGTNGGFAVNGSIELIEVFGE